MATGAETEAGIDIVSGLEVTLVRLTQATLDVIIQLTTCPLVRDAVAYVGLFAPTIEEPTCHSYEGLVPPFTGVAVKVSVRPEQVFAEGRTEMVTSGVLTGVTVTSIDEGLPGPHELLAVTEILPPAEPTVGIMEVEVEVPLQPFGKVHV